MYSQNDEESYILDATRELGSEGWFLDIGAHDGFTSSNTLALIERGWCGTMVEANPAIFTHLFARHGDNPKLTLVNAAVGLAYRLSKFWMALAEPGLSTADPAWRERRERSAQYANPFYVSMIPLMQLLLTLPAPVDVLSIDTEGTSVALFTAFPLDSWHPHVIVVEHEDQQAGCLAYAKDHGFRPVAENAENLVLVRS